MSDAMGIFRIDVEVENPLRPGVRRVIRAALVDTGSLLSWFPTQELEALGIPRLQKQRFRQANGTILERWTGLAFVRVDGRVTGDDVVFCEPGDLVLLGARSLEGLNLLVDPARLRLVDAGPAPAAAA